VFHGRRCPGRRRPALLSIFSTTPIGDAQHDEKGTLPPSSPVPSGTSTLDASGLELVDVASMPNASQQLSRLGTPVAIARPIQLRTWRRRPGSRRQENERALSFTFAGFQCRSLSRRRKRAAENNWENLGKCSSGATRTSQRGIRRGNPAATLAFTPYGRAEILFADDDPAFLDVGAALLRRANYEVAPAPSADIALDLLEEMASLRPPRPWRRSLSAPMEEFARAWVRPVPEDLRHACLLDGQQCCPALSRARCPVSPANPQP
jgi:hypothetical protein